MGLRAVSHLRHIGWKSSQGEGSIGSYLYNINILMVHKSINASYSYVFFFYKFFHAVHYVCLSFGSYNMFLFHEIEILSLTLCKYFQSLVMLMYSY